MPAPSRAPSYLLITPARNEGMYIRRTCESVVNQTILPTLWIIVDDGSTDDTRSIAQEYAAHHGFIRVMDASGVKGSAPDGRLNRGLDAVAFNEALATVDRSAFDYLGKLDADVELNLDYYELLLDEFDRDERLGICAGYVYEYQENGELFLTKVHEWHARGAGKIYRRSCFDDIGGIEEILGWDGIDEAKAQINGWYSRAFPEPSLVHHRHGGTRDGVLKGRFNMGLHAYILHYHPLFILPRAVSIGIAPPYVLGGLAFLYGYLKSGLTRQRRYEDQDVIRFIRRSQMIRLLGGRPYAMSGEELRRREQ